MEKNITRRTKWWPIQNSIHYFKKIKEWLQLATATATATQKQKFKPLRMTIMGCGGTGEKLQAKQINVSVTNI